MIYLSNTLVADLEESESVSSYISSSTSSITVFSAVLPLYDKIILPVTALITRSVLILGNVSNENPIPPVYYPNLNRPDTLVLE